MDKQATVLLGRWATSPVAFVIAAALCRVGAVSAFLVFPAQHVEATLPFDVHRFLRNLYLFEPPVPAQGSEGEGGLQWLRKGQAVRIVVTENGRAPQATRYTKYRTLMRSPYSGWAGR